MGPGSTHMHDYGNSDEEDTNMEKHSKSPKRKLEDTHQWSTKKVKRTLVHHPTNPIIESYFLDNRYRILNLLNNDNEYITDDFDVYNGTSLIQTNNSFCNNFNSYNKKYVNFDFNNDLIDENNNYTKPEINIDLNMITDVDDDKPYNEKPINEYVDREAINRRYTMKNDHGQNEGMYNNKNKCLGYFCSFISLNDEKPHTSMSKDNFIKQNSNEYSRYNRAYRINMNDKGQDIANKHFKTSLNYHFEQYVYFIKHDKSGPFRYKDFPEVPKGNTEQNRAENRELGVKAVKNLGIINKSAEGRKTPQKNPKYVIKYYP